MDPLDALSGAVAALVLVLLNGFFVAAEFSIVKVRSTQLAALTEVSARARIAAHIGEHLDTYLAACQVGITLSSLGLGWIGEPAIASLLEPPLVGIFGSVAPAAAHAVAITIAFASISFMHIVLGELAPKSLAIQRALPTSLWVALPLFLFHRVMYPFIYILNAAGNALVGLMGLRPATTSEFAHSPEEIRMLVDAAGSAGTIAQEERELVRNALRFADRPVRHAMVPRTEIVAVPASTLVRDLATRAAHVAFSRLPVYRGDLDHVIGVLHLRDLAPAAVADARATVERLVRPAPVLPEMMRLVDALTVFRQKRTKIGLVVDEFGGTAGLLTMEDIVEELFGELRDEFDRRAPAFRRESDGSIIVDGLTALDEVREELGVPLADEHHETLGGMILGRLDRVAEIGDAVEVDGMRFEVVAVDGRRVASVRVRPSELTEALGGR